MTTTKEVDVSSKILSCKLTDEEKETLAERGYKMQTIMNEGSCSLVYMSEYQGSYTDDNAVQRQVSLKLACKVMETEQAPKDFVQKFLLRELDIISQISHPHIIHTHSILHLNTKILVFMSEMQSWWLLNHFPYITAKGNLYTNHHNIRVGSQFHIIKASVKNYEFLDSINSIGLNCPVGNAEYGNLCDYITNYGGLREKQARIWFRQLAVGLGYLHTIHVAHRDIKCENILITCSFNVKICDFGFARFCADSKGKPVFSTTFCGSIAYAAPELIKGTPYVPMFSDVWSLGVVLYIMLNGTMPFRTDVLGKLWAMQITKNYKFKKAIIPRISKEVIDLISRMLEPNSIDRATIDEVLSCNWFGLEPNMLHYTPMEKAALLQLNDIQPQSNMKMIQKMMKANEIKTAAKNFMMEAFHAQNEDVNNLITKHKINVNKKQKI